MGYDRDIQAVKYCIEATGGRIGRTHLMKLIYLADLEARKYLGHPITQLAWRWWDFGPFTTEVYWAKDVLQDDGVIREIDASPDGFIYENLQALDYTFSPAERLILQSVVDKYAGWTAKKLGKFTYETEPMQRVVQRGIRGARLPMEVVDGTGTDDLHGVDFERIARGFEQLDRGERVSLQHLKHELLA